MDTNNITEKSYTQPHKPGFCWWHHPGRPERRGKPAKAESWCVAPASLYSVDTAKRNRIACRTLSVEMWLCNAHANDMRAAGYSVTKVQRP